MNTDIWVDVCSYDQLIPGRGVAALVGGEQVAVFRDILGTLYAVGNFDPCCGAYVISRGILGTRGDVVVVVSPMHKQAFDLLTGQCFDDSSARLPTYRIRLIDGIVQVARP